MAYNTKRILKDAQGKPIPQHYNPDTDSYEPIQGSNGASKVDVNPLPAGTNEIGKIAADAGKIADLDSIKTLLQAIHDGNIIPSIAISSHPTASIDVTSSNVETPFDVDYILFVANDGDYKAKISFDGINWITLMKGETLGPLPFKITKFNTITDSGYTVPIRVAGVKF